MIRLVGHPVTFMSRGTVRRNQVLMNHSWKHHLDSFYISKGVRGPSLVVQSTYLNLGYVMYTCIPSKLQLWLESSSLTSGTEYYIFFNGVPPIFRHTHNPNRGLLMKLHHLLVKSIEIHCFWMVPAIKMSQQHAQCWMRSWLRSWSGRCCGFFCVFRLESQINRSTRSGLTIQHDALPNKDGGLIGNMWYNQIQQACWFNGEWGIVNPNYFLRVIPTLTHHSDIVT